MQRKISNQITEGVIWKQLLFFFFPILLGTFFQQMYNTVDTIIVGRFVGTQALAAVGSTGPLINLINGFFIGLSSGATVILSQAYGADDRKGVHSILHTAVSLSLILGLLTTAVGVLAGPQILRLTQVPEDCIEDAMTYIRIYFSGAVASMVYNMGAGILRAMGDSKKPMIFLIIACFVNIALDFVCVVWLEMGAAGVAAATVLSQVISAVLVLAVLMRQQGERKLRFSDLQLNGSYMGRILSIGVPAGLQFITFDLANVLIQSSVNSFGDVTIAAWTAIGKTDAINWMICGAFGVAITTFVGQNFGAQKYARVRKSVWVCMAMGIPVVGAVSAIILPLRSYILGIYTEDLAVIAEGAHIMLYLMPFNAIFIPVEVFAGAMRGVGSSLTPTLITGSCVCLFRVLWVLLVVSRFHTIEMLAIAYPISWALAGAVFLIVYFRGNWMKKRIAQCGMEPEV